MITLNRTPIRKRNNQVAAEQRLHLLNSSHIREKIEDGPRLKRLLKRGEPRDVATRVYLLILSRYPTDEELDVVAAHTRSGSVSKREAAVDLAWALINSVEFLHRH